AAETHHEKFRAVPPDQAAERCLALLDNLPADAPRGIEFPLTGPDLTAVTRRYVNLLRED
ncbi:sugar phosphate isomerase/epimerase, partial [Klebsiella pneumoniae]|nr:sugar phosphate isomerase/epimerase [Klebsiella pneumoniae]